VQNLVEYIVRQKIYTTQFWKEKCFALTAESLLEVAVQLTSVGGTVGGQRKPSDFLCLLLKMLQIQPDKEIIIEYIKNEDFKYVRILGGLREPCRRGLGCCPASPNASRSALLSVVISSSHLQDRFPALLRAQAPSTCALWGGHSRSTSILSPSTTTTARQGRERRLCAFKNRS
jgi:hypothetical protein